MKNKGTLTGILIDPELKFAGARSVEYSLDSFYKLLHCSTIDIITRTVNGTPVSIICDDEAMLKDDSLLSATGKTRRDSLGDPMLAGALFIVAPEADENGDLVSLTEAARRKVLACVRGVRRQGPPLADPHGGGVRMKIETLRHIHDLLIEDEKRTKQAAKIAREAWAKAEEEEAPNQDYLAETYRSLRNLENAAFDALQDFAAHEWH